MKLNEIVLMPSGRLACITELTERQIYLTYEDNGEPVGFRRETFDKLWGAGKVTHHAHKQISSASRGVQPTTGGHGKRRAQLTLSV